MCGTFEVDKPDLKKRDNLISIDFTGHSIRIVLVLNRYIVRHCRDLQF
jgi:hypothetical protein